MKKGVIFIIAIVVIAVLILIGSLGMKIMDSAEETTGNQNSNNISNTTNNYSYNGATIKYGEGWQQEYVEIDTQKYKAICEKNGDIIIICLGVNDISDGVTDYSLSSKRQELYDGLIDSVSKTLYESNISISKQSNEFKELFENTYYAYREIYNNSYVRRDYTILNSENNKAASLVFISDNYITDLEEENIIKMFKTIEL